MKYVIILFLLIPIPIWAQNSILKSQVFQISNESIKTRFGSKSLIFKGEGDVLRIQEMNFLRLNAKQKYNVKVASDREHFYVVKNGVPNIIMNGIEQSASKGSMLTILPKDQIVFYNNGNEVIELYEMIYQSKAPMNLERGISAGGSFLVPWESAVFKPTSKGGGRQFFDRQTAMLNRFDIHVTLLNVGQQSHDPHTHVNEEIILMIDGSAEERIGENKELANAGDVIRVGSKVLHNITNVGDKPCIYYAIQWN